MTSITPYHALNPLSNPVHLDFSLHPSLVDCEIHVGEMQIRFETSQSLIIAGNLNLLQTSSQPPVFHNNRCIVSLTPNVQPRDIKIVLEYLHSPFQHVSLLSRLSDSFWPFQTQYPSQLSSGAEADRLRPWLDELNSSPSSGRRTADCFVVLHEHLQNNLIIEYHTNEQSANDTTIASPLRQRVAFYCRMLELSRLMNYWSLERDLEQQLCSILQMLRDNAGRFTVPVISCVLHILQPFYRLNSPHRLLSIVQLCEEVMIELHGFEDVNNDSTARDNVRSLAAHYGIGTSRFRFLSEDSSESASEQETPMVNGVTMQVESDENIAAGDEEESSQVSNTDDDDDDSGSTPRHNGMNGTLTSEESNSLQEEAPADITAPQVSGTVVAMPETPTINGIATNGINGTYEESQSDEVQEL